MKEEKLIRKRINPKGSVLFTVVAVMMVMIVFVMATLTIAGAANKRAYSSYSKSQTTYTAQAALDATVEAMVNDASIATTVNSLASTSIVGNSTTLTVESPDTSMGSTVVTATNYSTVKQLDATTGQDVQKSVIQLSATTTLGDESSTVSVYYIVDPVQEITTPNTNNNNASSNGITIMGTLNSEFQFNTYGGASMGVGLDSSRWVNLNEITGIPNTRQYVENNFTNDHGQTVGGFTSNGSMNFSTAGNYTLNSGEGIRIFGDFYIANDTNFITTNDVTDYNDLPYIFAEGNISTGSVIHIGNSDVNHPFVVYCGGSLSITNTSFDIVGDVYIYDHDFSVEKEDYSDYNEANVLNATSYWGTSANSSLISWAETLLYGGDHDIGGNLYTKGNLVLQQTTIGNDCYVKGDLTVNGLTTTINGNLCVDGNINCGDNSLVVKGTVYCGGTITGTIKDADGNEITDTTTESNKFDFPDDRETLDSIVKFTTEDNIGVNIIDTQPVEVSYYTEFKEDGNVDYVYATEIPSNYIDAVNGTIYTNNGESIEMGEYTWHSWGSTFPGYSSGQIYVKSNSGTYETVGYDVFTYNAWSYNTSNYDGNYYTKVITSSNIVTSISLPSPITSSCTISGYINKDIYVEPGANDIWIKLDNVSLSGNIIVNNEGSNTGKVNFFVPEGQTFQLGDKYNVYTTSAKAGCYSGTALKSKYRSDDTDAQNMIPNIYFYSGEDVTINLQGGNGETVITAYVYAPYASVSISSARGHSGNYRPSTYVDSYDIWNIYKDSDGKLAENVYNTLYDSSNTYSIDSSDNISVIGAIVADELSISNAGDTADVFFVDDTLAYKKSDTDDDDDDNDDGSGSGSTVITVADNTKIQFISSYTNG
ncbi:MAG: hypothetical protein LUG94_02865 [Ruminococcus sp.]|nr:hypothetical protein [Ruminococcus sp.]